MPRISKKLFELPPPAVRTPIPAPEESEDEDSQKVCWANTPESKYPDTAVTTTTITTTPPRSPETPPQPSLSPTSFTLFKTPERLPMDLDHITPIQSKNMDSAPGAPRREGGPGYPQGVTPSTLTGGSFALFQGGGGGGGGGDHNAHNDGCGDTARIPTTAVYHFEVSESPEGNGSARGEGEGEEEKVSGASRTAPDPSPPLARVLSYGEGTAASQGDPGMRAEEAGHRGEKGVSLESPSGAVLASREGLGVASREEVTESQAKVGSVEGSLAAVPLSVHHTVSQEMSDRPDLSKTPVEGLPLGVLSCEGSAVVPCVQMTPEEAGGGVTRSAERRGDAGGVSPEGCSPGVGCGRSSGCLMQRSPTASQAGGKRSRGRDASLEGLSPEMHVLSEGSAVGVHPGGSRGVQMEGKRTAEGSPEVGASPGSVAAVSCVQAVGSETDRNGGSPEKHLVTTSSVEENTANRESVGAVQTASSGASGGRSVHEAGDDAKSEGSSNSDIVETRRARKPHAVPQSVGSPGGVSCLRLKSIRLKGFKSFREEVVCPIASGFNCIVGVNGSGKSNVLDGVCFVLGLPANLLRCKRIAECINEDSSTAEVTLCVCDNGIETHITRTLTGRRGRCSSTYTVNSTPTDQSSVQHFFKERGLNAALPHRFVVLQQHTSKFLSYTPLELLAYIEGLLDLDDVKSEAEEVTARLTTLRSKIVDVTTEYKRCEQSVHNSAPLLQRYAALRAQFNTLQDSELRWAQQFCRYLTARCDAHRNTTATLLQEQNTAKTHITTIQEASSEASTALHSLQQALQDGEAAVQNASLRCAALTRASHEAQREKKKEADLKQTLHKLELQAHSARDDAKILEGEMQRTRNEMHALQQKRDYLTNSITTSTEAARYHTAQTEASNLEDSLRFMSTTLTQKTKETEKYTAEMAALETQYSALSTQLPLLLRNATVSAKDVAAAKLSVEETSKKAIASLNHDKGGVNQKARRYLNAVQALRESGKTREVYGFFYEWIGVTSMEDVTAVNCALSFLPYTVVVGSRKAGLSVVEYFKTHKIGRVSCEVVRKVNIPQTPYTNGTPLGTVLGVLHDTPEGFSSTVSDAILALLQSKTTRWAICSDVDTATEAAAGGNVSVVTRGGVTIRSKGEYQGGDTAVRYDASCGMRHTTTLRQGCLAVDAAEPDLQQDAKKARQHLQQLRETNERCESNVVEMRLEMHNIASRVSEAKQILQSIKLEVASLQLRSQSESLLLRQREDLKLQLMDHAKLDQSQQKEISLVNSAITKSAASLQASSAQHSLLRKTLDVCTVKTSLLKTALSTVPSEAEMKEHLADLSEARKQIKGLKKQQNSLAQKVADMQQECDTKSTSIRQAESNLAAICIQLKQSELQYKEAKLRRKRALQHLKSNGEASLGSDQDEDPDPTLWEQRIDSERDHLHARRTALTSALNLVDTNLLKESETAASSLQSLNAQLATLEEQEGILVSSRMVLIQRRHEALCGCLDSMNVHLSATYKSLCGVQCDCVLTFNNDVEALLRNGVQLQARPVAGSAWLAPQKLSGGQRSFVAAALVLGMQQSFPSPIYLFDELDAALDADKAGALAELLARSGMQILCISLRQCVYTRASAIIGVHRAGGATRIVQKTFV